MKRPFPLWLLALLHFLLGIAAFAGGGMLMLKPDGSLLGMQSGWLDKSPFKDYLLPGILLFILNGLLPLFTFFGLLLKPNWRWANVFNIYHNRHWAWTYSLYVGIIAITWIAVQQVMTQYFWIQPVIISFGLLIIVCTMTPSTMRKFETR